MDPDLRASAVPYFTLAKQWNFGRFLHHLDNLQHSSFPTAKKTRHEVGTELWISLLWEFAAAESHPENRFKALQELSKIKNLATSTDNMTATTNTGCMIEKTQKQVIPAAIPAAPKLKAKEVETQRCAEMDTKIPPPPYGKSSPSLPTSECSKSSIPPSPLYTDLAQKEIPKTPEQILCDGINNNANSCIKIGTPLLSPRSDTAEMDFNLSGFDCDSPEFFLGDTARLLAGFEFAEEQQEEDLILSPSPIPENLQQESAKTLGEQSIELTPSPHHLNLRNERDEPNYPPTPAHRVPTFPEFNALGSDCSGCCLHRYPPTQSLYSGSTAPASAAGSPLGGSAQEGILAAGYTPTVTHILQDSLIPEQNPRTVISTALTASVKATQNLNSKRAFEEVMSPSSSLCINRGSTAQPLPQSADTSTTSRPNLGKVEKTRRNIRRLLEMQKTVAELLLDVWDDYEGEEEQGGKRQRRV